MNELLEKYWSGTTTIEEEKQLRTYFTCGNVSEEHQVYAALFKTYEVEDLERSVDFNAFSKLQQDEFFPKEEKTTLPWRMILAAAAVVAIIAASTGLFNQDDQVDLGTYDDPKEAYQATVNALETVSSKFNNGKEKLEPVVKMNQTSMSIFNLNL